jgi:hypothetical protein
MYLNVDSGTLQSMLSALDLNMFLIISHKRIDWLNGY